MFVSFYLLRMFVFNKKLYICSRNVIRMIMDGIVFTPHSPISLKYWDMLKDLNSTVKMELAAMLTTSLAYKENVDVEPVMTEEERKQELLSLAGCWADDPEDAARMEAAIKDGRKNVFMREINLDD